MAFLLLYEEEENTSKIAELTNGKGPRKYLLISCGT